jgi:hypothetical protein
MGWLVSVQHSPQKGRREKRNWSQNVITVAQYFSCRENSGAGGLGLKGREHDTHADANEHGSRFGVRSLSRDIRRAKAEATAT